MECGPYHVYECESERVKGERKQAENVKQKRERDRESDVRF